MLAKAATFILLEIHKMNCKPAFQGCKLDALIATLEKSIKVTILIALDTHYVQSFNSKKLPVLDLFSDLSVTTPPSFPDV